MSSDGCCSSGEPWLTVAVEASAAGFAAGGRRDNAGESMLRLGLLVLVVGADGAPGGGCCWVLRERFGG